MKKLIQKKVFQERILYSLRRKVAPLISRRLKSIIEKYESNQDSKNLLYIHIPKCAGTSVAEGLGISGAGHLTVHIHQLRLSQSEYDSRYKFTFIRNPFDRMHSLYRYFSFGGEQLNSNVAKKIETLFGKNQLSFDDFVKVVEKKGLVKTDVFFKAMSDYICPSDSDEVLVDYIGKFETLTEDYKLLRSKINNGKPLAEKNKSYKKGAQLSDVYNDYTRNFVIREYAKDFRVFNYSTDL